MNGRLLFFSLLFSSNLVYAQPSPEELGPHPANHPENFLPEAPALPHVNVVKGRDNPGAIPLHGATLLMLYSIYGREPPRMSPAVKRFADRYAADTVLAEAMVTAIRQVQGELEANTMAQRQTFCARSFPTENSWKAAVIALDADSASAQVAAFNQLRGIAGPEIWERIVLDANEATRSMVMVQDNHDSFAAESGHEAAFSNQCRNR